MKTLTDREVLRRSNAEDRIRDRFPGCVVLFWWVDGQITDIAVDGHMAGRDDLAVLADAGFPVAVGA